MFSFAREISEKGSSFVIDFYLVFFAPVEFNDLRVSLT